MQGQKALEIARKEIGYRADGSSSKYFDELFPGERPVPWCLVFVEWVMCMAYGKEAALRMLYMPDGKFSPSITAFVNFVKRNNRYHYRMVKPVWLVFLKMGNEWTNHVEIVTESGEKEIRSIGGNCGGEVRENTYSKRDIRISGYAEIVYTEEP